MKTRTMITCEEFEELAPSLGPCELIDGEIRHLAPASHDHGYVTGEIFGILREFVKRKKLGQTLVGEVGIHVNTATQKSLGAGAVVISYARCPRGTLSTRFLTVAPELVIEVKRGKTPWAEVEQKVADYHAFGVDMVWAVDLKTEKVRAYPRGGKLTEIPPDGLLYGGTILPGFKVAIREFFQD